MRLKDQIAYIQRIFPEARGWRLIALAIGAWLVVGLILVVAWTGLRQMFG